MARQRAHAHLDDDAQRENNAEVCELLRSIAHDIERGVYDVSEFALNPHTFVWRNQSDPSGVIVASICGTRYTLTVELGMRKSD